MLPATRAAVTHLRAGRFALAIDIAHSLLLTADRDAAAVLVLETRLEQGWYRLTAEIARERFQGTMPRSAWDWRAAIAMHAAHVRMGQPAGEALNGLAAAAAGARLCGLPGVVALAVERLGDAVLFLSRVDALENGAQSLYIDATERFESLGDDESAIRNSLKVSRLMIARSSQNGLTLANEIARRAGRLQLTHLGIAAALAIPEEWRRDDPAPIDDDLVATPRRLAETLDDRVSQARALTLTAVARGARGEDGGAIRVARDALEAEELIGDHIDLLQRLSQSLWDHGDYATAEGVLRDAVALSRIAGDVHAEIVARAGLITHWRKQDEYSRAAAELEALDADPRVFPYGRERVRAAWAMLRRAAGHDEDITAFASEGPVNAARIRCLDAVHAVLREGGGIDWAQLEPAMRVFAEAEAELERIDTAEARMALVHVAVFRGLVLIQAGGPFMPGPLFEGIRHLRNAVTLADALRFAVLRGYTRLTLAFGYFVTAVTFDAGLAGVARDAYDEAFPILLETEERRELARAALYAAATDRLIGQTLEDVRSFHSALAWLYEADRWLAEERWRHREPGMAGTDTARIMMRLRSMDLYEFAIDLCLTDLRHTPLVFEWVERQKGKILAETIGTGALRPPQELPPEWVAEESAQLGALRTAVSRQAVHVASEKLEYVWQRMAQVPAGRGYVALRIGLPVRWEEVRSVLAADEERLRAAGSGRHIAFVEYFVHAGRLHALCIRSDFDRPQIVEIEVDSETLRDELIAATRAPHETWRRIARSPDLAACIEPLREWVAPEDIVCIVPAGSLFYAPLHAAFLDGQPLFLRNPVFYAPSASVLRQSTYRRAPATSPRGAVFFSDPKGDLKHGAVEAKTVAELLRTNVESGSDITRDRWRRALAESDVIHFTGHAGFVSSDPLGSGLVIAGGETLTARDFFAMGGGGPLQLVVLSGCETGSHDVQPGDEIIGLTRALLYAGASSLIVSLWPLHDQAARMLMQAFYRRWLEGGEAKVDALRAAQRVVYEQGSRNPFFWAPYVLIGDWL